jgi:hypothetical protein
MITQAQIDAQSGTADMTQTQLLALETLVKKFPEYRSNLGLYPKLKDRLTEVNTTDLDATIEARRVAQRQFLRAVLASLGKLPTLKIESSGSDTEQSFFSTEQNWHDLAQDTLDCIYDVVVTGQQQFIVLQRPLKGTFWGNGNPKAVGKLPK